MTPIFTNVSLSPPDPAIKRLLGWKKELTSSNKIGKNGESEQKWCEKAVRSLARKLKKSGTLADLEIAIANQDPHTPCVTIPRSADGRLQISERKGMPHVIYCRIWRFPDLVSHHELRALSHCRFAHILKREAVCINPFHYEKIDERNSCYSHEKKAARALPPIMVPKNTGAATGQRSYANNNTALLSLLTRDRDANNSQTSSDRTVSPLRKRSDNFGTSDTLDFSSDYSPLFLQNFDSPEPLSSCEDNTDFMDHHSGTETLAELTPMAGDSTAAVEAYPVQYCEPAFWCSVCYYELGQRVGEVFHAAQPSLTVDGFCDPSNAERFCLGLLSNVNRNSSVIESRKHIGRGARFYYTGEDVYVECLSDAAIFVQSINCNLRQGWYPTTVCKVEPGNNLKIFNNHEFGQMLSQSVSESYERVDALKDVCTIRISFVKGWGAQYRRQTITATPCWIEVHLNGPLQWLDRVLTQMEGPAGFVSSRT